MINRRLFDHYGIDTAKDLGIKERCPRPVDTVLIDKQGSCYACECTSWLPQSIGNLQIKSLDQIIGGGTHKHLQESIADGTYRYCNEHQCSYIKSGAVPGGSPKHIQHLRLAIDDSCNLRCPSCRRDLVFHKEGSAYNLGIRLADKINDWLSACGHPVQVHIGSDGDPFASHVYRHFMENTPHRNNITYSILTNGLLFQEFHKNIPHVINSVKELGVSIDGASKETYERLRLGGKWDKINDGLRCMSELKQELGFRFILHFVVQKNNYHELENMVRLGEEYQVDRVWFSRIQDWNTLSDFDHHNIFNPEHPEHQNLHRQLEMLGKLNSDIVEWATLKQLH